MIEIKNIIQYARNSKKHPDSQIGKLMAIIDEFGFTAPIVTVGNELKAGHGRLEAVQRILAGGGHIYPAPGRKNGAKAFPDGFLPHIDATGWTEAQARAYVIAENRIAELAEWDNAMLAVEIEDLRLDGFNIDLTGFDAAALDAIMNEAAGVGDSSPKDNYSRKIEPPIYEMTRKDKPGIEELFDDSKTKALIAKINASSVSQEDKAFLIAAAERHTKFYFDNIAEYYAHSDKQVQELMEDSALIIIDFNKAIEQGFIVMSEKLAEIAGLDDAAE